MSTLDDLLDDLFGGRQTELYAEFERWTRESRRFKAFAITYRAKIRAKLKNVRDEAGLRDLHAELETAALLLREKRFSLEYEKYAASRQRSPDFTVTFRTHTLFNVEVRRIRELRPGSADSEAHHARLIAILCDKVGQMPPNSINLLYLAAESALSEDDLIRATVALRQLAERKAEGFFEQRGYESAAHFLRQYQHLSGIILRHAGIQVQWSNALARHRTPPEIVAAIQHLKLT